MRYAGTKSSQETCLLMRKEIDDWNVVPFFSLILTMPRISDGKVFWIWNVRCQVMRKMAQITGPYELWNLTYDVFAETGQN